LFFNRVISTYWLTGLVWHIQDKVIGYNADGRTDRRTKRRVSSSLRPSVRSFVRSFVSLSVVSVMGVHNMGERMAMLYRNLRADKTQGSTNKHTKFGQLIIRKIIKIIATRCYIMLRL